MAPMPPGLPPPAIPASMAHTIFDLLPSDRRLEHDPPRRKELARRSIAMRRCKYFTALAAVALLSVCYGLRAMAQERSNSGPPPKDSSTVASDGTAYVTRVVPVPTTISPEAQQLLANPAAEKALPSGLEQWRLHFDALQVATADALRASHKATVESRTMAGVPVKLITPATTAKGHSDCVLINLHGGGGTSDTGSITESAPLALRSQTEVIAVLYRLAPEHPFPAAVEDAVAVYREVLKTHQPRSIGIFGTSSGAVLTAEVAVRLKQLGLPTPGALGIFSGTGDFSRNGDSQALFTQHGLTGNLGVPESPKQGDSDYLGKASLEDPVVSPVYADLHGMPPTLFITSTRDMLLSGTTILHRAFLRAGVDARLIVFEALPHAFWEQVSLPESQEAIGFMADFFNTQLRR